MKKGSTKSYISIKNKDNGRNGSADRGPLTKLLRFLEGPHIFICHHPPGEKAFKSFAKLHELPARLIQQIFPEPKIVPRRNLLPVMIMTFDTDTLSLELSLRYLLCCVTEGKLADVANDNNYGDKILGAYKVLEAETGVTRMIQSASKVLRRFEAEEKLEKEIAEEKAIAKLRERIWLRRRHV